MYLIESFSDVDYVTHECKPRVDAVELGRELLDEAGEQALVFRL